MSDFILGELYDEIDRLRDQVHALRALIQLLRPVVCDAERYLVEIESEWGRGYSMDRMVANDDSEALAIRRATDALAVFDAVFPDAQED